MAHASRLSPRRIAGALAAIVAASLPAAAPQAAGEDLPVHLRDRGPGVATSMFGTYVRKGEVLVYPFFEWYADSDLEYKPSDFGYADGTDYRGKYRASEGLLFLGYGLARNVAIEVEAAVITAKLWKASEDASGMPDTIEESGLGDVEAQIRWRFLEERGRRPEAFAYFETVFPLQKDRQLIGTQDWEYKLGVGLIRGFAWGTLTARTSVEYSLEEGKLDAGEYALEYLKRISPSWRVVAVVEGVQLDEVSLIGEVQWHFHPRAFVKVNCGFGVTENATDFAPEIGLMISL
jgi:hypothetical protein